MTVIELKATAPLMAAVPAVPPKTPSTPLPGVVYEDVAGLKKIALVEVTVAEPPPVPPVK